MVDKQFVEGELDNETTEKLRKLLNQWKSVHRFAKVCSKLEKDIKKLIPDTPNTVYVIDDIEIPVEIVERKAYTVPAGKVVRKPIKYRSILSDFGETQSD